MNQLSWLLYLADVASGLEIAFRTTSLVSLVVGVACLLAVPATEGEVLEDENPRRRWFSTLRWSAFGLVSSFVLLVAVPEKETVYAIAASEMGEQVVSSPTGQKAMKAIDAWLDRQIAGQPAE